MSRRTAALLPRWSSRVFSVEHEGLPLYFGLREGPAEAPEVFRGIRDGDAVFSLLVGGGDDRIRSARCYAELGGRLTRGLPPGCTVAPLSSFLPRVQGSLLKGYLLRDPSGSGSAATECFLRDLLQRDPVLVCAYVRNEGDRAWAQRLWTGSGSPGPSETYFVVPSEEPGYHPATLNIVNSDVFYSFQEAHQVLQQATDVVPEALSVLERLPVRAGALGAPDHPVVVFEGLDATGKTTLTEALRDALGATLLRSPPPRLSPWRARFDKEPPLIRRAFYAVGNYVTAEEIAREAATRPVIVDRFWHSTAAYAIATAVGGPVSNLPKEGSEVYNWPADLLRPSLVVLLTLDPEERKKRLRGRGLAETREEQELDHNQLFRLRVEEAYRRIAGPACVTVDASPSADQVLQQVLLLIKANL